MQVPDSTRPLSRQIEAIQEMGCEKAARLELETTPGLHSTINSGTPRAFKYIPEELIRRIQSYLPVDEGARTTVLSKSWLHAWSTNPNLSFYVVSGEKSRYSVRVVSGEKRGEKSAELVERTLTRYLREKISIEKLNLEIDFMDQKYSPAEKLIGLIATITCLKEFSISVRSSYVYNFTLSDELLLCENLTKIRVQGLSMREDNCIKMMTSLHPVIKCVSLRELDLFAVQISEQALNHILSYCTLLVKIQLRDIICCKEFKNIKVKNLPRLYELHIGFYIGSYSWYTSPVLEISGVPNLHVFKYIIKDYGIDPWGRSYLMRGPLPFNGHSLSLSNVRRLELGGVPLGCACLDMITSGFLFLESLALDLRNWKSESFHFTCASIKILSLVCTYNKKLPCVQIFAPKLLSFSFYGRGMPPDLLFPVSSLMNIKLSLSLVHDRSVDHVSFFVKLREALTLSPKCNIDITAYGMPLDIDIDDLRRRLVFPPATNVQQLDFVVVYENDPRERSPFFEAFFEICHPKHVIAQKDDLCGSVLRKNHFCRSMLKEVMEKKKTSGYWPDHLKHVLVRLLPNEKWEPLTNSNKSILDGSASVYFKLEWG